MASVHPLGPNRKSESPIELNIVGRLNSSPLLELKAKNQDENEYLLKVKDASGNG